MLLSADNHIACPREGSGSGIVTFGDAGSSVAIGDVAARKQDLAVHEQHRRGQAVICGRVSGSGERAGRGIVDVAAYSEIRPACPALTRWPWDPSSLVEQGNQVRIGLRSGENVFQAILELLDWFCRGEDFSQAI